MLSIMFYLVSALICEYLYDIEQSENNPSFLRSEKESVDGARGEGKLISQDHCTALIFVSTALIAMPGLLLL